MRQAEQATGEPRGAQGKRPERQGRAGLGPAARQGAGGQRGRNEDSAKAASGRPFCLPMVQFPVAWVLGLRSLPLRPCEGEAGSAQSVIQPQESTPHCLHCPRPNELTGQPRPTRRPTLLCCHRCRRRRVRLCQTWLSAWHPDRSKWAWVGGGCCSLDLDEDEAFGRGGDLAVKVERVRLVHDGRRCEGPGQAAAVHLFFRVQVDVRVEQPCRDHPPRWGRRGGEG